MSKEILLELRTITQRKGIPLIFNETASKFYAYDEANFYASSEKIKPDAIMTYHGGQLATVNINEKYFLDQPLMLISTWDGDEFSAHLAYEEYSLVKANKVDFMNLKKQLQSELVHFLSQRQSKNYSLKSGVGYFEEKLPPKYENLFTRVGRRTIVNPSFTALKQHFTR